MDKDLFAHYTEFLSRLDILCNELYVKLKDSMQCRKGCTMCCISGITVIPVEAYYIAENMPSILLEGSEPASIIKKNNPEKSELHSEINGNCVFLQDGLCAIYPWRPVLCRTQGFPLLYGSEPHIENEHDYELSYCELNFKDFESFNKDQLLDMDRVNLSLAAINIRFLHKTGLSDKQAQSRIRLTDIVKLNT